MHLDQIAERLKEFERLCRCMGVPLTVQRRAVLETVLERDDHPTADQIIEVVRQRVPGVSRTTVYRVLDRLVEVGIIRRLHHHGPAARFDGKIRRHHHLICKKCNQVIDLESAKLDKLSLPDVESEGFEIDDFSVQFTGTCAACRQAKAP
jgi:Fur family peroxide stress response transcriptional regulator